jgi:hypothetical protein
MVRFLRSPQVESLCIETFTLRELAEAFNVKPHDIAQVVSRFGLFLISDPVRGNSPRLFTWLDALAILLFLNCDKIFRAAGRENLLSEVSHLLFGDLMSEAEATERRAEIAAERRRNIEKHDKFLVRQHLQRREELRRDPFAASPIWWSRNADQRWALFVTEDCRFITMLADRTRGTHKIDYRVLEKIKAGYWVNLTELFTVADGRLAEVITNRAEAANA